MNTLTFLDANDITFLATLDGIQYRLRLCWNDRGGFWTLSIRTPAGSSLLEGVKVVPNYTLLKPYHRPGIPPGELLVITADTMQAVGRQDFADGRATLVYATEDEVNAI